MTTTRALCPACQTPISSGVAICATCGRVLASTALATIPMQPATAPTSAPPTQLLRAGQALAGGRYVIQRPLSQGGMGALFLATDREAFDRTVVIKVLLDDALAGAPQDVQAASARFEREARTLASLTYPTIPQIFSYFADGARNYIVMAYVEGRDLSQGLTRADPATQQPIAGHACPLADVLRWGVALCRTLEYLASRTPPVIHQDIKPANLILNPHSGELFLVDFGAARARAAAAPGGGARTAVFGTPGYAAPEQYQGQSDPKSDIYALAATLYHLVTDDDPSAHPFAFPRLGYLGYLGPILRAALQPDPARRPTASALREQIEALLVPESSRVLYTPDGLAVADEAELAAWCEQHWAQAAEWLAHGLPDQVQVAWVKLGLAENLRQCRQQHQGDRDAGLDAALALLDRTGFGAAQPALAASPAALELKTFVPNDQAHARGQLIIRNSGRRYVHASVGLPTWMKTATSALALAPGQQATLALELEMSRMPTRPRDAGVRVRAASGAGITIPLQGQAPPVSQQPASPWLFSIVFGLWLLLICVFGVVLPMIQSLSAGR